MNRAEYKALYAAQRYGEGLARKRERNMPWFLNTFLPSVAEKIGKNPKYPDSCVVSDKQADVLWFYMENVSALSAKINSNGTTYTLELRGNWWVLIRRKIV